MPDGTVTPSEKRTVPVQLVVGVLLAAGVLAFVFQNTDDTQVKWLWMEVDAPLWIILLVTGVVALVAGELVSRAVRRLRRRER
jgi:uncharacterized integral membrane protein